MKTFRASLALLFCSGSLALAQVPASEPATTPGAQATPTAPLRTAEELDQLVGPIALYPDALIALILPASTVPADIVLAARHLRDFPDDRSQIEHRAWDDSVKSLTSYPELLKWMDENLQWTKQLGEAFAAQPADVMQAVQRLRAKARAAGTLVDTPQQQIIAEPEVIRIVPAQPDIIYVPRYDPEIVFVDRPVYYREPFVSFGFGVAVGSWLAYDCDWHRRTIWCGDRHRRWTGHDWRRPLVPIGSVGYSRPYYPPAGVRRWTPPPQPARPFVSAPHYVSQPIVRPVPLGWTHPRNERPVGPVAGSRETRVNTTPLPPVNPLTRTFTSPPADLPGPRVAPAARSHVSSRPATISPPIPTTAPLVVSPATPVPSPNLTPAAVAPAPHTYTSPRSRRSAEMAAPRVDTPARIHHVPAPQPAASLPVAPPLPMASATAPRNVPMPAPSPVTTRSYSHPMPAPAAVPSLPMAQHAAPTVSAPGPTAPPQSAPAPSRGDGGNRGSERRYDGQRER